MFRKWVMGGLALLILVLFVWVSSKQLLVSGVKKRLLDSLQEVTGEGVTLGGIDLSLFPPSLILQDLKLPGDQVVGQVIEGQELLTVKEARLWFSPWSFFTEFFVIQRLELSEPRLYLIRDGEQRSNFDRVIERLFHSKASAGEFHPPKIVLKKLSIRKGQVYYKTEVFSASLPDITVTLLPDLLLQKAQIHLQTGSASLDWENHHLPIDQIDGLLLFNPKGLTIKNLTVKRSDSHLALRGEIHDLKQPRLDLYLGVTLNSGDFPSSLSSILPISGSLRFQTEIQGSAAEPAGKGNLSLDPFLYHQQSIGPFSMLFSYQVNGSTLSMTQVQGRALGGDFSGQFKLPLTKNFSHYETELELSGIDPFPFLAYFYPDLSGFSKPVHAHLSLKGSGWTISSLDGRGSLTLRSSQTPSPIPVPSARLLETPSGHKKSQIMKGLLSLAQQIDLQFTLSHKRLSLLSAHLSTPRSILALAGTIDEDQKMILAYHLAPGDLGELLPLFGLERLEGRAELSGLLTGSLSQPLSQAHLTVAEANYKGRAVGSLSSQLLFQNDALDISPALLQKGSSLYKLLGRITFPREKTHLKEGRAAPVYNLTLHIEKGIPQEVVALFYKEIPIHGSAGGDLYLTGTPKEFQLKGTLNVGSGSAYGQPFDSGSVTGIVERNGITLEHVGLRWNDTVLAGQGTISFDGSFSAQLSTEGFQLEEIKLIHNLFPALTGTITGIIRGKGPFRDPHVTLTADIARIAYEGQDLGEGRVEAALEERKLRVHSDLFEKALSFTGHLGLISPYPYEVGLLLNQVRIDPFLALAQPKLFSALLLSSTGEISGMGTLSRLQEASFQISLSDLRLQLGEHLVRNDGDIRLQYQGGVLKVDALKFQGEETTLAISGSLEPFREYNLFVRGETDLNLLRLFTREITHGKGKAYLALRIFDRWSDPKIRGGLTSQGGTIRSETLSQTVNLQSLGLLFNEKQILLESLEGEVGGGHLSGSGKVDIKNFATEAFGLILELKDVRFHVPEGLSSLVEGALIFQGTSESRDLKGEVVIKRATYTKRVEWKSWITEIIAAQTREQKGEIPLVGNTHLNIHITGKENIWIDNNLAKFPLIVDLYLRGTLNRPLLLGRVEAREGTFFFRRNTFKITNGSIDFINPERTQPIFDVKAKTTVRNYQIDLNLSGSLDSFRLALTSDPPLSETDILALLVVGKTAEEVAAAQKGVGTTEVVSIATGDVQDIFEQRIEELTGIDRFQVDPYYSGTKTAGGPRLTVSKKLLNDDLVVTYSVTLDPSEEQTILMEYLLSQNIFLEGRRDELGRLLGNIKFRFEFR